MRINLAFSISVKDAASFSERDGIPKIIHLVYNPKRSLISPSSRATARRLIPSLRHRGESSSQNPGEKKTQRTRNDFRQDFYHVRLITDDRKISTVEDE